MPLRDVCNISVQAAVSVKRSDSPCEQHPTQNIPIKTTTVLTVNVCSSVLSQQNSSGRVRNHLSAQFQRLGKWTNWPFQLVTPKYVLKEIEETSKTLAPTLDQISLKDPIQSVRQRTASSRT